MKEFKQYKIKAKDLQEKVEIIRLFVGLGCEDISTDDEYLVLWVSYKGRIVSVKDLDSTSGEWITIEQLREMSMKEYLVKVDGEYILHVGGIRPSGAVEVPEWAEWAKLWDKGESYECVEFYKGKNEFFSASRKEWMRGADQSTDKLGQPAYVIWQRNKTESVPSVDVEKHDHYFINVSDVDEVDFYEIAGRFGVTDPCVQHILKKCLAIGKRGHKDAQEDMLDIYKTAKRMIEINGVDQ